MKRALAFVRVIASVALGIALGLLLAELRQRDLERAHVTTLEQRVTALDARIHRLERRSRER